MSQTQSDQTLHSLEALAVLLPSLDGACTTAEDLPPDDALADEALLGLASRLQQALSGWRAQLDQAAALDAQALALARRHAQLSEQLEREREHWRQQKGWRTLQELVDSLDGEVPCLDDASGRLLSTARAALARRAQHIEQSLSADQSTLEALAAQVDAIEQDPALRLYRAEQERQARRLYWQQMLDWAQARYPQAQSAAELAEVQSALAEVAGEMPPDGPLHAQAEQLLAMLAADQQRVLAAETEAAERAARACFGQWLKKISRRIRPDDLVLTFGIGQGAHVALTDQRSARGHRRVMLVSAVGFELLEPVLRTLIPNQTRAGYFQLQPGSGLPGGGHARQFDWRRPARNSHHPNGQRGDA